MRSRQEAIGQERQQVTFIETANFLLGCMSLGGRKAIKCYFIWCSDRTIPSSPTHALSSSFVRPQNNPLATATSQWDTQGIQSLVRNVAHNRRFKWVDFGSENK
jgi:hypothetical protein